MKTLLSALVLAALSFGFAVFSIGAGALTGPKRFNLPVTVGKLIVDAGKIRSEIFQLLP